MGGNQNSIFVTTITSALGWCRRVFVLLFKPAIKVSQRFAVGILSVLLLLICEIGWGQSATATWSLTSNTGVVTSGNITATALSSNGVNTPLQFYPAAGIFTDGWPKNFNQNSFYQYTVSPSTGYNFTANSISFYYRRGSNGKDGIGLVYYSLDGFTTAGTQLGANFTITNTEGLQFTNSTTISVSNGSTLTIRVYAYDLDNKKNLGNFYNMLMVVSGTSTLACLPPTISSISGNTTPCEGSSQSYSVDNVAGVTYAWSLPSGWTGSSTSNSITATVGSSSGTITVTPSNACGQGAARTLPVTITSPINTHPLGVLVFSGASTSFSVSATGATGYQWQVSTDKGGSWTDISEGGVYSNVADATLNISNVNGLNGNLYRCSVSTTSCGIVLSNSASLTIDVDSDSDGVSDSKDLDDDNDGISDIVELTACNNATLTTGTTLFSENFGTGTRTSTIYTNYCYESGSGSCAGSGYNNNLNDGEYAILRESKPFSINYGAADHGLWISTQDHTVGDTGGRMIVFNAAIAAGEFYRRTITVEPNVPIMVSFWVINLMASGSLTKPNIYVQLQTTDGDIIAATTGEIDQDQAWHEFTFTTYCGNITEAELILTNEATGGDGNDLAIDDILIKIGTDCDTDGDGTPDRVDLDSDDDGCKDVREAGFTDSNNDGKLDGSGVDANGLVAGYSSGYTTPADGNGDGTRDYLKAGTAPTILAQPTNRSICGGTSANFSVSASNANKYQWQVSTNGGSTWSDLSNTGIYSGTTTSTLTLTNATTAYNGFLYQVIVSNTAYACSVLTSDYATLSVNTARPANSGTITGASSVCASSSANVYNASATNATTYTWSVPSGWTINSGQGTESISVTAGASGGTISENASNGCGASITNSTFDVSVISQPTATITGNNSPICAGSTVTFNLTGTSGSTVTYNINGETSSTVTLTGGVATVSIPNTVENKVLTLESVASGICTQILSSSSTVSVNALPTASILGNNGPICSGSTATFTLSGTSGSTVTYNINGGTSSTVTLTGGIATVSILNANLDQTLTFESVTDGTCSQFLNSSSVVSVNALPTASISVNNSPICSGSNATFTLTGTSGATVTYNINGGSPATVVLTGGTATVTISGVTANQTLTLESVADVSCSQTLAGSSTVTVNPLPTPTFPVEPDPVECQGDDVIYTTEPGLTNYTWSIPGTNGSDYSITTGGIGAGSNTVTLKWLTTGSKIVTVGYTDGNGCVSASPASSTITVNPTPVIGTFN